MGRGSTSAHGTCAQHFGSSSSSTAAATASAPTAAATTTAAAAVRSRRQATERSCLERGPNVIKISLISHQSVCVCACVLSVPVICTRKPLIPRDSLVLAGHPTARHPPKSHAAATLARACVRACAMSWRCRRPHCGGRRCRCYLLFEAMIVRSSVVRPAPNSPPRGIMQ